LPVTEIRPPTNCEKLFRVFFPIGALLGLSPWPLYYAGAFADYLSILHARLMSAFDGF